MHQKLCLICAKTIALATSNAQLIGYGHVVWREDIDVGVNRSQEDIQWWRKRDPISFAKDVIQKKKIMNEKEINNIERGIDEKIQKDWERANTDPSPVVGEDTKYLYKS